MSRIVTANIVLTDADQAACAALPPPDQQTFLVAKLAAGFATPLGASLAKSDILAILSESDQQALEALIAAVKAVPNG
jgi:hypothetical protein